MNKRNKEIRDFWFKTKIPIKEKVSCGTLKIKSVEEFMEIVFFPWHCKEEYKGGLLNQTHEHFENLLADEQIKGLSGLS